MAIFKKNDPPPQKARERSSPPSRAVSGDAAISIIGQGMTVVGDISTEGIVRVEGQVRGTVQASKAVILGQGGVVDGNVLTEDAVIGGTVSGSIVAGNRLELQSTCLVRGEIRTRAEHLKLEEGARFAGQVQMINEEGETDSGEPQTLALPAGATQNRDGSGSPLQQVQEAADTQGAADAGEPSADQREPTDSGASSDSETAEVKVGEGAEKS